MYRSLNRRGLLNREGLLHRKRVIDVINHSFSIRQEPGCPGPGGLDFTESALSPFLNEAGHLLSYEQPDDAKLVLPGRLSLWMSQLREILCRERESQP